MTLGRKVKAAAAGIMAAAAGIMADTDTLGFVDEHAPVEWTPEKALVSFGTEVKALGDGKIGGYLIRHSDETEPDLSELNDWFHEGTYLGAREGNGVDVTINHGIPLKNSQDPEEKKSFEELAAHLLPPIKTRRDKVGLFAETIANMADEYDRMVYDLAQKGKLRWSSGAVGHLVKRTPMPNGTNRVDQWIIGEAALTPIPAEPRLGNVIPIKAYADLLTKAEQPAPKDAQGTPSAIAPVSTVQPKQETKMADEVPAANAELTATLKQLMEAVTGIRGEVDKLKAEPPVKTAGIAQIIADSQAPAVKVGAKESMADEQLHALKSYLANAFGKDEWKAHQRKVEVSSAKELAAWHELVHDPLNPYKQQDYQAAMKASIVEGTASLGGNLVPTLYSNTVVANLKENSIVRQAGAYQFPVSGTNSFSVATLTRSGSAPIATELAAASQMEPTFGAQVFTAYAYRARYIAAREAMLDTRIPLEPLLMENASWQLIQSENNHLAIGTGSSQPAGIAVGASTLGVSPGSTVAIAFASASGSDNVYEVYHGLPYQYRAGACWFAADSTIKAIRKIRTGGGGAASLGDYFWRPGGAGDPSSDMLLGRPLYPLNNMATSGSTGAVLIFGDPRFFWISDFNNGGMDFQILNELYAASAAVGWWFWKRFDSHLMVGESVVGLKLLS